MAPTSPLTTLATMSTPESYQSYHTAKDSPPLEADTTGISSPIRDDDLPPKPRYRHAVQPVHELKAHCQIHLEEELFLPAILLLDNLLTDGSPSSAAITAKTPPARVAPPPQLAILSTLTIHPTYTSRVTEPANAHIACRARTYLRGVLALTGPVNSNLRAAFSFVDIGPANRGRESRHSIGSASYRHGSPLDDSRSLDSSESDCVEGRMANEQSLWRRAPDFWSVLGWAFRCSAEHPRRWQYWKGWLEFMVDVLESDWDEREQLDKGQRDLHGDENEHKMVKGSLLVAYLNDLRRERKNVLKEVIRALMAFTDDDPSDKAIYREVFDRELAVGSRNTKRKRSPTVVDLENDKFGDYFDMMGDDLGSEEDDDEQDLPASPTAGKQNRGRGRRKKEIAASARVCEGTADTVPLRLRLFRLLSAAANCLPDRFCQVGDLYERFTDRVRSLPLPVFRLFVESHTSTLPPFAHVSLLRNLVEDLLPNNAPEPDTIDPDTDADNGLSPLILEKCFLPFAASKVTLEDNAKLSLVLESMLWFMYARNALQGFEGLGRAVEKGIQAREDKIRKRAGCKDGATAAEKAAREALDRSTRSLRVLVQVIGV